MTAGGDPMTTGRATITGPAHVLNGGRSICGGSPCPLAPGDAPGCRQCARSLAKRDRVRESRA